jgi:alkylation response protein AidB-like acyl-CoA dehydrogenase
LNGLALGTDAQLGAAGQGLATLERAIGRGVLALCAESLGAMEAAKAATLDYLRTRKQFGVLIGSFQALQHRMADLLLEIEQARSAVINAAAALDADRLTRERALSAAKLSIGRIGALVAEECIQLHGGIGMTWELPLAHYAKRLVMIDHQLGDEDHHLQRFIALGRKLAA